MQRVSWFIWVGPKCSRKCPYEREAGGDLTAEERWYDEAERAEGSGLEDEAKGQEAKDCSQVHGGKVKERDSSLELPWRGPWFQPHKTHFGLLTFGTVRGLMCVILCHQVCGNFT